MGTHIRLRARGFTRRQALKTGLAAGAGLLLPWGHFVRRAYGSAQLPDQEPLDPREIPKFIEPLPHFAGAYYGLTRATGSSISVGINEARQKVLPASMYATLPSPFDEGTFVWGYDVGGKGTLYPGVSVEAVRGVPTDMTFRNNLTDAMYEYLTVDQTVHWANPLGGPMSMDPYRGPVPIVPHLHGGEVPPGFDGGPNAWFTPDGLHGSAYFSSSTALPPPLNGVTYSYPNCQPATTLWFHDHALGVTRINVYAGLAAFYLLRDGWDTADASNGGGIAPLPYGPQELEIAIQDRMFDTNGQWFFPDSGEDLPNPDVHPFWIPEFTGDAIVVNGKTWPYLEVEPRRYRFRLLNGSNARTYDLFLQAAAGAGPAIWQIGTDGGLLEAPVRHDPNAKPRLLMMPGERADVIIDFSQSAGQTLLLKNTARTPYPKGDTPHGSTLGQILQFRVTKPLSAADTSYDPAAPQRPLVPAPLVRLASAGAISPQATITRTRQLTLNEVLGPGGPLEVLVNNTEWVASVSEHPREGTTEVWEFVNTTADAHPIHLHLVQFQLINRQAYNAKAYFAAYAAAFSGGQYVRASGPPLDYEAGNPRAAGGNPDVMPFLQGPARPPAPNEDGWKDTVQMLPGEVTRIAVRFAPTDKPIDASDLSYPFDPSGNEGFVFHCHIIDHEDNEMMRPYTVEPIAGAARPFTV